MDSILFAVFASVALVSALMMIVQRRLIYSVGFMIVVLISVSGLFLLMNAPFLALVNAVVYAGAVMMFFVFTAMLLGASADMSDFTNPWMLTGVGAVGLLLLVQIFMLIGSVRLPETVPGGFEVEAFDRGLLAFYGSVLLTKYAVVLQAIGVLLLVALVGAIYLSRDPGSSAETSSLGRVEESGGRR